MVLQFAHLNVEKNVSIKIQTGIFRGDIHALEFIKSGEHETSIFMNTSQMRETARTLNRFLEALDQITEGIE